MSSNLSQTKVRDFADFRSLICKRKTSKYTILTTFFRAKRSKITVSCSPRLNLLKSQIYLLHEDKAVVPGSIPGQTGAFVCGVCVCRRRFLSASSTTKNMYNRMLIGAILITRGLSWLNKCSDTYLFGHFVGIFEQ